MTTIFPHSYRQPQNLTSRASYSQQCIWTVFSLSPHLNNPNRGKLSTRSASTATATRVNHHPRVNPPSSTLPAPLVLPYRSPSQSAPSYYYSLGRAYLSFYKNGLKAVYTNFKDTRSILNRLPPSTSLPAALKEGLLSRGEWQFVRRSREDVSKIPLFALLFMICGEFTPLVVIFFNGVVPRTCMIPKQIASAREKAEERRGRSFRDGTIGSENVAVAVGDLERNQVLHIGRSLGLHSKMWDRLSEVGLGGVPLRLVKWRIEKRVEYLDLDDVAVERDGGVGQLDIEEVKISLEERGLDVLGKNDPQLRGLLDSWLKMRKQQQAIGLLLMRPSVWVNQS